MTAQALYPSNFQFKVNVEQLREIVSDKFQLFNDGLDQKVHSLLSVLWKPTEWAGYYGARIIEPLPGENKGSAVWTLAVRVGCFVAAAVSGAAGLALMVIVFPLHLWNHSHKGTIQFLSVPIVVRPTDEWHLRTHNVALGPESFVALTDLRPNKIRAQELVSSILQDPLAPRFMIFQEAYNQIETLTGLKEKYPYILHSIAPDALGTSSGFFVASQDPIEEVEFRRLPMEQPEQYICRGALKVRIRSEEIGSLDIYGVHLQALLGKDRAVRRLNQLQTMKEWMVADYKNGYVPQVLIGDFNTSYITAWGEDNLAIGLPEREVLLYLENNFIDCYGEHHDPKYGRRNWALPHRPNFLSEDNRRMGVELPEPTGSLCHGPFSARGIFLSLKMAFDAWKHGYREAPIAIQVNEKTSWGSPQWHRNQKENPARLDHAMIPKYCNHHFAIRASEIRRIPISPQSQSAASDHLPLDVILRWSESF